MDLSRLFNRHSNSFDVSSVKFKKPIDEQLVSKHIYYLQSSLKELQPGCSKILVRISPNVNSLTAGVLLKQAIPEKMLALILDFGQPVTQKLIEVCKTLLFNTYVLNRSASYQQEISAYKFHTKTDTSSFYQKFINYHLSIQAQILQAAVLDTWDKSDRLQGARPEGFYGSVVPFYSLYKSEIFDLAKYLKIPEQFITHTAYQQLPYPGNIELTCDQLDPVLFLLTEEQMLPEEVSLQCNIDLAWLKKLKSRLDKQALRSPISQFII